MTLKKRFTLLLFTLLPLAAGHAASTGDLEVDTIRYQSFSGGQVVYAELADALGYLAPLKLNRLGIVTGGPADIQATATDQVDFGQSFNGAILNAYAAGAPIKAVIGYHGSNQEHYYGGWVLEDSPIRSAADLPGKKVGVNTLGAAAQAYVDEYLKRGQLSAADQKRVTLVPIPPPNAEQALRQKQLDVAIMNGGFQQLAQDRGGLRKLFSDYDLFGEYTFASVVMNTDFLKKNPKASRHFVGALARAIEWSQTQPREKVIQVYGDYLTRIGRADQVPAIKLWDTQAVHNKGGVISKDEFGRWAEWLTTQGQLKAGLNVEDVYTNDYNPYAK
ncbi:ABC transporter substrate-binding protein [Bordetella genomosp. 13]|uniref:ABC transporter substrate-binding protein n=1 Tax=Bordetella genomosp. 13 TaxID=463040 RepID=UPI0011AA01E9|nr:ABC transporter substrate-binding protein [Bordetella genomosp. 13]